MVARTGDFPTEEPSDHHLDLASFYCQRQSPFRTNLETRPNRVEDVRQGRVIGFPLADAPRNGGTLHHPCPVFVPLDAHEKFRAQTLGANPKMHRTRLLPVVEMIPRIWLQMQTRVAPGFECHAELAQSPE